MREIKFRMWDELTKAMTYVNHYSPDTRPKFIWMQFTGLKDEEGKEIYEGDILGKIWTVFVVEYGENDCDNCFGFNLKSLNVGDKCYAFDTSVNKLKIMGNIYENPELLDAIVENQEEVKKQ